ncbi:MULTISPECIES: hypothetical protein [Amycolatopsis]|uniref:Uncharacterized protein n=1 Tax=Amycolatopsis albidoflavus TaxID=102226 RepID=A0ABW5I5I7_9PSEU
MSIQEEAESLRAIASSDHLPIGMVRQMQGNLQNIIAEVAHTLGRDSNGTHEIANCIGVASAKFEEVLGALQNVEKAIHDAADYHARG